MLSPNKHKDTQDPSFVSRYMRREEHVPIVGEMRNVYKVLVTKHEKATWERRHTSKDNI
jgi:hypothetical protein